MDEAVLGIDVGSQGTCVAAFDVAGERLATASVPHTLSYPRPLWAEQDPGEWVTAAAVAVRRVLQTVPPSRVRALSFGSQLDGLVCIDAAGHALRPAIIWMDRRADAQCEGPRGSVGEEAWYARSGCNLDGSHVAAKIAWVREHDPDAYAAARRLLLPGSWMALAVAGVDAVDPSNASSTMLLDPRSRAWDGGLLSSFGVDPELLPPVVAADADVGGVAAGFAEASGLDPATRVVLGCGDEMAATVGAGVVEPGWVCDVLGTAEPVCAVTAEPRLDPGRLVECHPHGDPESWLLENPGWFSGGAYRWFRDELGGGRGYHELNELAEAAPAGSDGVLFLPAMMGAMAPEWNGDARGAWYGLTPAHGRGHLLRALLEGSAYALRDNLEAMRRAGLEPSRIVCVAGGARGHLIRQMRADVTGLPVTYSEDVETTARGAAMLAAAGAGLHPTVAAAAAGMSRLSDELHEPDPGVAEVYGRGYRRYRELYRALRPLFGSLT
ncbi:MAG: xylulokinase [Gaiellales bacterium]